METKKKGPEKVTLIINGFRKQGEREIGREFFQILQDVDTLFLPTSIERKPFSMDLAENYWKNALSTKEIIAYCYFKGKINGNVGWRLLDNSVKIILTASLQFIQKKCGTKKFEELAKKLFLWSNGVYGFSFHSSRHIVPSGIGYQTCLFDISWMTLLGPPYVKMFGKEKLQSAPCDVEEFADDYFMLLASKEPVFVTRELNESYQKIKTHLGVDAFYRHDAPARRRYTFEEVRAGIYLPSKEGYRSPDLSEYMNNPDYKEEGMILVINKDGTKTIIKTEK